MTEQNNTQDDQFEAFDYETERGFGNRVAGVAGGLIGGALTYVATESTTAAIASTAVGAGLGYWAGSVLDTLNVVSPIKTGAATMVTAGVVGFGGSAPVSLVVTALQARSDE